MVAFVLIAVVMIVEHAIWPTVMIVRSIGQIVNAMMIDLGATHSLTSEVDIFTVSAPQVVTKYGTQYVKNILRNGGQSPAKNRS
tara:strand:- start:454 stop:705 length:252 start_codon:yes stop_codon:yes gene_type:complete